MSADNGNNKKLESGYNNSEGDIVKWVSDKVKKRKMFCERRVNTIHFLPILICTFDIQFSQDERKEKWNWKSK